MSKERKPAKIFQNVHDSYSTTESIIWYKVCVWMSMNGIYIIRTMLCYVQVFTSFLKAKTVH